MKTYVASYIGSIDGALTYGRMAFEFDKITASDVYDMENAIQAENDNKMDNLMVLGWSELEREENEGRNV
ncbi:MAG: hypothetical protein K6F01_12725 [Selenomonas sp.]|uniref:hypothetical protein n=1 Tax=Selenomonas sp. TaxID=2053611 RepID=UPI0025E4CEE3|nr:hypothetical protein [Selenomonas sp.]MCR5440280.1 hypothetical protein [Selenomonas sp.]